MWLEIWFRDEHYAVLAMALKPWNLRSLNKNNGMATASVYMMVSWHGNTFRITSHSGGKPPITGGFPSQRASSVELWCCIFVSMAWTSCWTYIRIASDLRRSCNVTIMYVSLSLAFHEGCLPWIIFPCTRYGYTLRIILKKPKNKVNIVVDFS